MLNTIYETGYDLHVANYVAYLHTDKKLYEDEAHKVQAKKADVEKAFKLGRLIVVAADKTYLPVALMAAGVVVTDGTTATTCTMARCRWLGVHTCTTCTCGSATTSSMSR